jgi:hypothetical protein
MLSGELRRAQLSVNEKVDEERKSIEFEKSRWRTDIVPLPPIITTSRRWMDVAHHDISTSPTCFIKNSTVIVRVYIGKALVIVSF